MPESDKAIEIEVLRYRPEQDREPFVQTFKVPFADDMSVLQGLQYIKDDLDGTLSFRWSCRMAICGSCGMMINGVPKLACRTFLRNYHPGKVRIGPMEHFPIERDLVVVVEDYVKRLEGIKPYLIPKKPRRLEQGEYLQTPPQLDRYNQFSACINCMLCYAACPIVGLEPDFVGPAAIALAQRYNLDSRDEGAKQRLKILSDHAGIWGCTFVGECTQVCPKHVDPAGAIQQFKLTGALDAVRSLLLPWGTK